MAGKSALMMAVLKDQLKAVKTVDLLVCYLADVMAELMVERRVASRVDMKVVSMAESMDR